MFCENCGKQNPDGTRFCENCGAPMQAAPAAPAAAPAAPAAPVAAPAAPAAKKPGIVDKIKEIHKKNKLILPLIAAVLVVAVVLVCVFTSLGKRVQLKNYLDVEVTGYEGYGDLDYEMDLFTLFMRMEGNKDAKQAGDYDPDNMTEMELSSLEKKAKNYQKFMDSIKVSMSLPEGRTRDTLRNGDVVTFEVTCNEALAKKLKVKIITGTFTYEVQGLQEASVYDLLSNFDLKLEGYNGYGKASVTCLKTETKSFGDVTVTTKEGENRVVIETEDYGTNTYGVYIEETKGNLKNGDKLVLTVHDTNEDRFVEQGLILTGMTKEIEVAGLKELVTGNLFEYINCEFTGIDGDGRAKIVPKQDTVKIGDLEFDMVNNRAKQDGKNVASFYFNINKNYDLKNGGEITIELSAGEDTLAHYGVSLSEYSKKVTVSGLGAYASGVEGIKKAGNYAELEAWGKTVVNDYLNDSWGVAVHSSYFKDYGAPVIGQDMKLHKLILTTPKSTTSYTKNTLWLVYSVTLDDDSMDPTLYYFAVYATNVVVMGDGTVEYMEFGSEGKYTGSSDYDKLYNDRIYAYNLNIFE